MDCLFSDFLEPILFRWTLKNLLNKQEQTTKDYKMQRITRKHNDYKVEQLNKLTNNKTDYMTKLKNGKYKTHIGHYCINSSLNNVSLVQVSNSGGGVRSVFYASTEREFNEQISSILSFLSYDLKSFTPNKLPQRA